MKMSTTNSSKARVDNQAADQKMIDGFNKHAQTVPSLFVAGTTLKAADIITVLQTRLSTANAAQSTRGTWQNAVKADRDERAKTKTLVDGVRQALLVALSGSIDVLADFGLSPRKPRVLSPEKKAVAAARAKATRKARGTMGKVQKKGVKGAVTATLVVTPQAGSQPAVTAPAPVTTPAPAPAPATGAPATAPTPVGGTTPHAG
jgi:hypothetical protein